MDPRPRGRRGPPLSQKKAPGFLTGDRTHPPARTPAVRPDDRPSPRRNPPAPRPDPSDRNRRPVHRHAERRIFSGPTDPMLAGPPTDSKTPTPLCTPPKKKKYSPLPVLVLSCRV